MARNYYDSGGRLIAMVDANGNTTQFIHNLTNSLEVIIDQRGNTNTYAYDSRGNITAVSRIQQAAIEVLSSVFLLWREP